MLMMESVKLLTEDELAAVRERTWVGERALKLIYLHHLDVGGSKLAA